MRTALAILALAMLGGCIDREAIRAEVKAAVLSPEITMALSNHIQGSLDARIDARIEKHESTTQSASAGDQTTSGTGHVAIGGGNTIQFDGGVAVLLGLTITGGLLLAYLIRGGYFTIGNVVRKIRRHSGKSGLA